MCVILNPLSLHDGVVQLHLDVGRVFMRALKVSAIPIAPLQRLLGGQELRHDKSVAAVDLCAFNERVQDRAVLTHAVFAELDVSHQFGQDD